METKLIKGLNQIQSNYDAFFIDLWGVIHNGIKLYPGAVEVLENLHKLKKMFRTVIKWCCLAQKMHN